MIQLPVKKADTLLAKSKGLLGQKKPYALFFQTRFGIHTFGMQFPIDVIILDKHHTIVRLKKHLLPNRIFLWPPIWDLVIELPDHSIKNIPLHIGDSCQLIIS